MPSFLVAQNDDGAVRRIQNSVKVGVEIQNNGLRLSDGAVFVISFGTFVEDEQRTIFVSESALDFVAVEVAVDIIIVDFLVFVFEFISAVC